MTWSPLGSLSLSLIILLIIINSVIIIVVVIIIIISSSIITIISIPCFFNILPPNQAVPEADGSGKSGAYTESSPKLKITNNKKATLNHLGFRLSCL